MNRDEKSAVIDQVAEQIQESQAIFALDYRGITVAQAAELRANLREADASLRVVKNTLTELAADKAGAEDLKAFLDGPTAFTFVRGDAAMAAKALAAFRKEYELLEFKGGRMDGARRVSTRRHRAIRWPRLAPDRPGPVHRRRPGA